MRVKNYYFISPKEELLGLLSNMDELSIDTLSQNQLWESEEGGKSLWSLEDYAARVKLSFLINLRTEYAGTDGIVHILSKGKISVSLFDKYWSIEPILFTNAVGEVPERVLLQSETEFSGLPCVDEWLSRMIKP
jgi:hypothetical protein